MKKLLIIISLFMTCIFGFANEKTLDVDVIIKNIRQIFLIFLIYILSPYFSLIIFLA